MLHLRVHLWEIIKEKKTLCESLRHSKKMFKAVYLGGNGIFVQEKKQCNIRAYANRE